jgi:hypothetical protein
MRVILTDQEGDTEEIDVCPIEGEIFEIRESPLLLYPDVAKGDIVRLCLVGENLHEVQEVLERPLEHHGLLIPGEYGASPHIYDMGKWIVARGGDWECIMDGILLVHLPAGLSLEEVEAELDSRLGVFVQSEEYREIQKLGPMAYQATQSPRGRGMMTIHARPSPDAKNEEG